MGPQSEGGPSGDGGGTYLMAGDDGRYQSDREMDMSREVDMSREMSSLNVGSGSDGRGPTSPAMSNSGRDREGGPRNSGERDRSRTRRRPSKQLRICNKCGEPLLGQFVRALGGTFHLDCFKCQVSFFLSISFDPMLTRFRTADKSLLLSSSL